MNERSKLIKERKEIENKLFKNFLAIFVPPIIVTFLLVLVESGAVPMIVYFLGSPVLLISFLATFDYPDLKNKKNDIESKLKNIKFFKETSEKSENIRTKEQTKENPDKKEIKVKDETDKKLDMLVDAFAQSGEEEYNLQNEFQRKKQ